MSQSCRHFGLFKCCSFMWLVFKWSSFVFPCHTVNMMHSLFLGTLNLPSLRFVLVLDDVFIDSMFLFNMHKAYIKKIFAKLVLRCRYRQSSVIALHVFFCWRLNSIKSAWRLNLELQRVQTILRIVCLFVDTMQSYMIVLFVVHV